MDAKKAANRQKSAVKAAVPVIINAMNLALPANQGCICNAQST